MVKFLKLSLISSQCRWSTRSRIHRLTPTFVLLLRYLDYSAVHLRIDRYLYLSAYLFVHLSICPPIYLSAYLFVHLSVFYTTAGSPSICLRVNFCVYLSTCLCVCFAPSFLMSDHRSVVHTLRCVAGLFLYHVRSFLHAIVSLPSRPPIQLALIARRIISMYLSGCRFLYLIISPRSSFARISIYSSLHISVLVPVFVLVPAPELSLLHCFDQPYSCLYVFGHLCASYLAVNGMAKPELFSFSKLKEMHCSSCWFIIGIVRLFNSLHIIAYISS